MKLQLLVISILSLFLLTNCDSSSSENAIADGDSENANESETDTEFATPTSTYFECPDDELLTDAPRGEHPRPDFCRATYRNLNGIWQFAFDPDDKGLSEKWYENPQNFDKEIIVPFSWQSKLSGIEETDYEGIAWYFREFEIPKNWPDEDVHMIFGSVDWEATIWINGKEATKHTGGYSTFRINISEYLQEGKNQVILRVFDPGDDPEFPHGKQGEPWYTNVGGIWQTVYLEVAPKTKIDHFQVIQPKSVKNDDLSATMLVNYTSDSDEKPQLIVYEKDTKQPISLNNIEYLTTENGGQISAKIDLTSDMLWSPNTPRMTDYTLHLCNKMTCDDLTISVGFRSIKRDNLDGINNQVLYLNDEPLYIRGVLVQGYHPDGLMSYPTEQIIWDDLVKAKDLGFNLVRLHIKPEEPRVLHIANTLGLLVDYDMVCLGSFPFGVGDTKEGRKRWEETAKDQIIRDRNHPSILWWTLFNETWGLGMPGDPYNEERQTWVKSQIKIAKEMLPNTIIEDMSPTAKARDHVDTDLITWHFYKAKYDEVTEHLDEVITNSKVGSDYFYIGEHSQAENYPLINTEFGPFSYEPVTPGWKRDRDISHAFHWMLNEYRKRPEISGYIFTQLYDVEFEKNGMMDYDRKLKEDGFRDLMDCNVDSLQKDVFIGFDGETIIDATELDKIKINPWISTYKPENVAKSVTWELARINLNTKTIDSGTINIDSVNVGKTKLDELEIDFLDENGVYIWRIKLGESCNYLPIISVPEEQADWEKTDKTFTRFISTDLFEFTKSGENSEEDFIKLSGKTEAAGFLGSGILSTEFSIENQQDLNDKTWAKLDLGFEIAANIKGMTQTDPNLDASEAQISVCGISVGTFNLKDDPADARGILTHYHIDIVEPSGGYGYYNTISVHGDDLTTVEAACKKDKKISLKLETDKEGGLILYGRKLGRIAEDAKVVVTTK